MYNNIIIIIGGSFEALSRDGKIAVASSVTVCRGFNLVLHCWFSVWTQRKTVETLSRADTHSLL